MSGWTDATPPDLADLERLARDGLASLPPEFAGPARAVALRVVELAPDHILDEMEIDDPYTLTGLYDGIPLTEKSVADQPHGPDTIWLFRRAILDEWVARGDIALGDLVVHVLVHELAHHFGWSDADIASIDEWWT
ncbi:metallopeptidase family protein [Palleronia pontilimi]|uniref:metallopeptidase family protein n=1 Tax=Palleronia pontilimi TaxID=1964209 RepID=UPI0034CDB95A